MTKLWKKLLMIEGENMNCTDKEQEKCGVEKMRV
jgi:hypothetical protein